MRFAKRIVDCESFVDCRPGLRKGFACRKNFLKGLRKRKGYVRIRKACESKSVRRIFFDRLAKVFHCLLGRRFRPLVSVIAAFEQRFVRVGIDRPDVSKPRLLVSRQGNPDRMGDLARQRPLQNHDIAQDAVVAFRPQQLFGVHLDDLRGDTNPLGRTRDAALHDGVDIQVLRDLSQRLAGTLQPHDRRPRNHAQGPDLAQLRDQLVCYPIGEIFLLLIARLILQRQYRNGTDRSRRCGS